MKLSIYIVTLIIALMAASCRKSSFEVDNHSISLSDDGAGTGTVTWTADHEYLLEGLVFVNDGQVLTIEPGTVIKFKKGQGNQASALIVARGGKIIARGSADKPIIFTSEDDRLDGNIALNAKGLWGGLIILGNARLNTTANEGYIEGLPLSEPRGIYGGYNDDDSSGILSYVSIRHCGSILGFGNEINGLTLGAVGRKTEINHIEVVGNADDGIEIFGGTVNMKHIAIAFCDDDALDTDEGYRGKIQYIFAIQDSINGDLLAEHDGGSTPIMGKPYATPTIANASYVGNAKSKLIQFSDNAGGAYYNSIFINQKYGISIEYDAGAAEDSYKRWTSGELNIASNIFYQVANDTAAGIFTLIGDYPGAAALEAWQHYFYSAANSVEDPGIMVLNAGINPLPAKDVSQGLHALSDPFFEQAPYKGAFGSINWLKGWTLLDKQGFILP